MRGRCHSVCRIFRCATACAASGWIDSSRRYDPAAALLLMPLLLEKHNAPCYRAAVHGPATVQLRQARAVYVHHVNRLHQPQQPCAAAAVNRSAAAGGGRRARLIFAGGDTLAARGYAKKWVGEGLLESCAVARHCQAHRCGRGVLPESVPWAGHWLLPAGGQPPRAGPLPPDRYQDSLCLHWGGSGLPSMQLCQDIEA